MDEESRIQTLIGRTAALQVICMALIEQHPAPAALEARLRKLTEQGAAQLLNASGSDEMLHAYQQVIEAAQALALERVQSPGR